MTILLTVAISLVIYMSLAFGISQLRKDNGTADMAYGFGFVLLAWISYALTTQHSVIGLIASVLVTIWASRLSLRIYLRSRGKPEDFRYAQWRKEWGTSFLTRSFLQVYMLQGLVIFVVALPVTLLNIWGAEAGLGLIGMMGLTFWIIGFVFEVVGDMQLDSFLKRPENKGHVMSRGLWRFTRHPNYFGESLMWIALALVAYDTLSVTIGNPLALVPFVGPALITFLLLKVSGVPLLEKRFSGNPEWELYKARTSMFIPLPPVRSK